MALPTRREWTIETPAPGTPAGPTWWPAPGRTAEPEPVVEPAPAPDSPGEVPA